MANQAQQVSQAQNQGHPENVVPQVGKVTLAREVLLGLKVNPVTVNYATTREWSWQTH
jgi:hypothetical protein